VLTALHDEREVRDTILHEIAHALVGPSHGHDAVWRRQALAIGSSGQRCVSSDAPAVAGPWVGTCPSGHTATRHRQPVRVQSCGRCSRGFDAAALIDWTYRGRPVAMHPSYEAERRTIEARAAELVRAPGTAVAARSTAGGRAAVNGPALTPLEVGTRVTVLGRGKYSGRAGAIVKVGRSRYQVKAGRVLLTVPFVLVEPRG
jgi:hypothetical protein